MSDAYVIPRPWPEYAEEPFDPNLTFTVNGCITRHIATVLDERYIDEPVDSFPVGSIPPEECEVRHHVLVADVLRNQVTSLDLWWSRFFRETERYRMSLEAFSNLEALCSRSREHRAAFLRIANGVVHQKHLRAELRRTVERADARADGAGKAFDPAYN
jgi:hypothetical protein